MPLAAAVRLPLLSGIDGLLGGERAGRTAWMA